MHFIVLIDASGQLGLIILPVFSLAPYIVGSIDVVKLDAHDGRYTHTQDCSACSYHVGFITNMNNHGKATLICEANHLSATFFL